MQNQTAPRSHGIPESFYIKFGHYVTAVLSGFDRIGFGATLRVLYQPSMMDRYLGYCGVKLKDLKTFAESTTAKVKAAAYRESTTMNELFRLTRQRYEKNETEASLLSKVTKILESLPDGSVDSSQLAGLVTWASRKFLYPRKSAARPP